jgi:uroporphyrinogen-III decarboxylase
MNSRERFSAALDGDSVDRVPVMYQHLGGMSHIQQVAGISIQEAYSDPKKFAQLGLTSLDVFGYDNVMAGWGDLLMEAHAFGAKPTFSNRSNYPSSEPAAIVDMEAVEKLSSVDPFDDSTWSVPIKAARIMKEEVGKSTMVLGCTSSPFIVASGILGYENLMVWQMLQPEELSKLLAKVAESLEMLGVRLSNYSGLDAIFISGGLADAEQNTLEMCLRFDLEPLRGVVQEFHRLGLRTIVHNCSYAPFLREQIAMLDPKAIHFWVGARDAGEVIAPEMGRRTIVAGIDHQSLIYKGSLDEIEVAVAKAIKLFGDRRTIIAPACELLSDTPVESARELVRVCERYAIM